MDTIQLNVLRTRIHVQKANVAHETNTLMHTLASSLSGIDDRSKFIKLVESQKKYFDRMCVLDSLSNTYDLQLMAIGHAMSKQ